MIIVCPACETRYDLPESAIGPEGRTVRCAQCRHSWFQPGPGSEEEAVLLDEDAPPVTEEETAAGDDVAPTPPPFVAPDEAFPADIAFKPLDEEELYEEPPPRRRRSKAWLWLLLLFVALAAAISGALAWYGVPDWLPIRHTALATNSRSGLALDFPSNLIERKTLADGTEFFGARGTVTNTGATRRNVPPIEIVLRDSSNQRVVYRWDVVAPKSQLGPGESMTITEAVTDIPHEAIIPQIGWKAG